MLWKWAFCIELSKKNSIALKDFHQKMSFYFIGNAVLECMNEITSNKHSGKRQEKFMNKMLSAGVWNQIMG